ncbi:MAG TPA: AMP-binding protein [Streptosporangiaceae bacterium]|nr:AMP-binding protein [Streptosporangiaceae bacterium]
MTSRPLHAVLLPPVAGGGRLLAALAAALEGTGPAILPLDPGLPAARLRAVLDAFAPAAVETPDGIRHLGAREPGGQPPALAGGQASDAGIAVVIATSGSTGPPKGVALSAAALRASAASSLTRIGARPGQRWLCCLPGFHVAGLQVLVRSLLAGADPLITDRADPATITAAAGAGCAFVSLVPTQLRRLLDAGAPLAGFDTILLGGAAPPAGLLADAREAGARVVTTYGMSETCGGCVYDGRPLEGVRLRITAADQPAPPGTAGRIGITGPVLLSGYWPRGSRAATDRDGWFWTSDLGSLDSDGRLTVRGRADDVINTGGEKVIPGEVEAVLGTIRGVRDVVVIGVPDSEWGEVVTAVVVPADPAAPPDLAALRAGARDSLPGYAAPRRMLVMADIPVLPSGKPDRLALRRAGQRQREN